MHGRIEVPVADGVVDARLFVPDGAGPFPVVLYFHDAGGLRPATDEMAERWVASGYAVVAPNLYRRSPPFALFDFATVWTDPPERARIRALMDGFTPEQAMADAEAVLASLDHDPRLATRRIGVIGYCMGGRITFFAAAALADRVVAAASIHGGGLVTPAPNSPHLGCHKIRGRMYFGVADRDASCTAEAVATLEQALTAAGVPYQVEWNPGALHGYAMKDFPVYDEVAAERHWQRALDLFGEALPATR